MVCSLTPLVDNTSSIGATGKVSLTLAVMIQ
jgi:hypothetical protein